MAIIYLSLGSNIGDRLQLLRAAVEALQQAGVEVMRASPVYETEPVDLREQPWFLNCVIEAKTSLTPEELLALAQSVERQLGRDRAVVPPKGPRTIDIDIIFYGDSRLDSPGLVIPHPRFRQRRFVLTGLAALAPELRDPESGQTMLSLLQRTTDVSRVERVSGALVL